MKTSPSPASVRPLRTSGGAAPAHRSTPGGSSLGNVAELPSELALAFAPLHKAAFGLAIGTALGLTVLAITIINLLRANNADAAMPLSLLGQYFYGYTVSWLGAFIGFAWGMVAGFVAGWFFAFCRNFVLAASMFVIKTRAELSATRDFLDHV